MHRFRHATIFAALTAAVCLLLAMSPPALADDSDTATETTSDSSTSDTASDTTSSSSDTVTTSSSVTTWDVSVSATTARTGPADASVRTICVNRPKITATTTTTTTVTSTSTGESTSTTTKTKSTHAYALTVKIFIDDMGWKRATLGPSGVKYVYKAPKGHHIEAVKITCSASLKNALKKTGKSLFYRTRAQTFGMLGWARCGQAAGSTGQGRAMLGITLRAAKSVPGTTDLHFVSKPSLTYRLMHANGTWTAGRKGGATAGTATWRGVSRGLAVKVSGAAYAGSVSVSVRTGNMDADRNWSEWTEGASGVSGAKRIQALRIKLTGKLAKKYNVFYRVFAGDWCWLGWAQNGQKAGTKGIGYAIGAVQVKIVAKGSARPGSSSGRFVSRRAATGSALVMLRRAQHFSSESGWLILVNRATCRVGVFFGSKGNWKLKSFWWCAPGNSSSPTIRGNFTISDRGYSFGTENYTCYYWTRFRGNYLFHSVLYYPGTKSVKDGRLGMHLSHGCVRLAIQNAKWIYDTIPRGTRVNVYG